ncbi:hypothetical protein D3C87_1944190 [compost metagenome]
MGGAHSDSEWNLRRHCGGESGWRAALRIGHHPALPGMRPSAGGDGRNGRRKDGADGFQNFLAPYD